MVRLSWRGWLLAAVAGGSVCVQAASWPSLAAGLTDPHRPAETLWALLSAAHMVCGLWALGVIAALIGGRWPTRGVSGALVALCLAAPPASGQTAADVIAPESLTAEAIHPRSPDPPLFDLHEVEAGDTLWAIAAHHLPEGAAPAQIAAAVQAWHRDNLTVVGIDPDLIHPGQILTAPRTGPAHE